MAGERRRRHPRPPAPLAPATCRTGCCPRSPRARPGPAAIGRRRRPHHPRVRRPRRHARGTGRRCSSAARFQIAFYGSTRNYAFQFDDLGFDGTSARLNERLKAGDVAGMAALITDEMLEHFAVVAPWDELADALAARYDGIASRLVMYLAEESIASDPKALGRWGEVARAVTQG